MKLAKLLAAVLAVVTIALIGVTPGCGTLPERPPRTIALDSLRSTYDSALTAYENYVRLYVAGQVKPEKKVKVDAAWVKFSAATDVAVQAAALNWSATTPANVLQLKTDLLILISSL